MQYIIVSDTGVSFYYVKSYPRRIQVKLISYFSVYRCHGNIDFPKKYIISCKLQSNSNIRCKFHIDPSPEKFLEWSNENVWYGPENL